MPASNQQHVECELRKPISGGMYNFHRTVPEKMLMTRAVPSGSMLVWRKLVFTYFSFSDSRKLMVNFGYVFVHFIGHALEHVPHVVVLTGIGIIVISVLGILCGG